jgi:hypothetical protein
MAKQDIFSNTYDSIISLGHSCMLCRQLQNNDLWITPSPFDWLISSSTVNVAKQFEQDFKYMFLNTEITDNQVERSPNVIIRDTNSGFLSYHDVKKDDFENSYAVIYEKFQHKAKSLLFRIANSKKTLFIRKLEKDANLNDLSLLYDALRKRFPENDFNVLYIKQSDQEQGRAISKNQHLLCFDTKYKGINEDINWVGDNAAWQKALRGIKAVSRKDTILAALGKTLMSLGNRKIVIWGLQYLYCEIEQLLLKNNMKYFAYDKALSQYQSNAGILQDTSFLDERDKPFVIVNTRGYHEGIIDTLLSHGFIMPRDCYYF